MSAAERDKMRNAVALGAGFLVFGVVGLFAYASTYEGDASELIPSILAGAVLGLVFALWMVWYALRLWKRRSAMPGTIVGVAIAGGAFVAIVRGLFPTAIPFLLSAATTCIFVVLPLGVVADRRRLR